MSNTTEEEQSTTDKPQQQQYYVDLVGLTLESIQVILYGLGQLPLNQVKGLYDHIETQTKIQMQNQDIARNTNQV